MVNSYTPGENYSAQEGAFEGPEKLLEIWFSPSPEGMKDHQDLSSGEEEEEGVFRPDGLRVIPRPMLDKMLSLVKCTVLNMISNKEVDAYVLR
jgi:S-adenosylmethionine decarboxylase